MPQEQNNDTWKTKWFRIIFRHDTRDGKLFDEVLLILILWFYCYFNG